MYYEELEALRSRSQPTSGGTQQRLATMVSRAVKSCVVGLNPRKRAKNKPRGTKKITPRLASMTGCRI